MSARMFECRGKRLHAGPLWQFTFASEPRLNGLMRRADVLRRCASDAARQYRSRALADCTGSHTHSDIAHAPLVIQIDA